MDDDDNSPNVHQKQTWQLDFILIVSLILVKRIHDLDSFKVSLLSKDSEFFCAEKYLPWIFSSWA